MKCLCCGLDLNLRPNGLCGDCAENCAGYILRDQPCKTIYREIHDDREANPS